jgi:NAD(P)-dependent dehydrogenase (short-subunit alcohol dehydrogenase family)
MATAGGNWKDLLKASGQGDVALIRYHLQQGVDPNFQHPEYFTCPIFDAVRNGHWNAVKVLIEEGNADPNCTEELSDQTPIEAAVESKHYEIAEYLNSILPTKFQHKFRKVLVTGGNRGIGKAIVEQLLNKGHRVVFTCRTDKAGASVRDELKAATRNPKVDYIRGDLSSIQSTLALAKAVQTYFPSINVLIHTAGVVWPTKKQLNADGLEVSFAINYLAPYLLTRELTPLLESNGPDSRIVFVSGSKLYILGKADIATTPVGKDFHRLLTYMHTQQCGMILFLTTARRLQGNGIAVNAVYPRAIRTGRGESAPRPCCTDVMLRVVTSVWSDPAEGAIGPVWLAESMEAGNLHGNYYDGNDLDTMPESVTDPRIQKDWEQWTRDFLEAKEGKMY